MQLTPVKGPESEADMAITFVSQKELTEAEVEELKKTGRRAGCS